MISFIGKKTKASTDFMDILYTYEKTGITPSELPTFISIMIHAIAEGDITEIKIDDTLYSVGADVMET